MKLVKTYNYKNHLIWKYKAYDYIIEAIDQTGKTLRECKSIINGLKG